QHLGPGIAHRGLLLEFRGVLHPQAAGVLPPRSDARHDRGSRVRCPGVGRREARILGVPTAPVRASCLPAMNTTRIPSGESQPDATRDALSELAYAISHDLTAPFLTILGFAQFLSAQGLDSESRDLVDRIEANAKVAQQRLRGLVDYVKLLERPISRLPLDM